MEPPGGNCDLQYCLWLKDPDFAPLGGDREGATSAPLQPTLHYFPGIALRRTDRQTVPHPWPFLQSPLGSLGARRETRPCLWPASNQSHKRLSAPCGRTPTVFSTPRPADRGTSFHTAHTGPPMAVLPAATPQSPGPLSGSTQGTKLAGSPEDNGQGQDVVPQHPPHPAASPQLVSSSHFC